MIVTTRFRYLAILVGLTTLVLFSRPHKYLPTSAQDYIPYAHKPNTSLTQANSPLKQNLWDRIHALYVSHQPTYLGSIEWPGEWPTMPKYQMNKTYDKEEVVRLSPTLAEPMIALGKQSKASFNQAMPRWNEFSTLYSGTGYVMTTGSGFLNRVFPIGLQMLHRLGSNLPIEIWCKNEAEYDVTYPVIQSLVHDFGMTITCHRFSDYVDITQFPEGYTSNYLMKAMTALLSSFEHVIMLDADNVPMQNPEQLLQSPEYLATGLLLWPDFWSNSLSSTLHTIFEIPYTFTRTCESGQMVIDKNRHFASLIWAIYFNWYGDAFYKLITLDGMGTGDKDTFVVGAQTMQAPFHFVEAPVTLLRAAHQDGRQWREDRSVFNGAMGQFDPHNDYEIMFMHMHSPKLNFQDQEEVTLDLLFVQSDEPDRGVRFVPSQDALELKLWESIAWIECDSVLVVENDPKHICEGAKARVANMTISR